MYEFSISLSMVFHVIGGGVWMCVVVQRCFG